MIHQDVIQGLRIYGVQSFLLFIMATFSALDLFKTAKTHPKETSKPERRPILLYQRTRFHRIFLSRFSQPGFYKKTNTYLSPNLFQVSKEQLREWESW